MTQAMTGASVPARRTTDPAPPHAPVRSLVFVTSDVPSEASERLTRAGLRVTPFQPGVILAALAEDMAPCAVLWADPTARLTGALEQGTDPVAAITAWQDETQALLAVFRRNRRRLTLIEAQVLTSDSGASDREFLRNRLACPDLPLSLGPDPHAGRSLAAMVAAAVIPQIAEIKDSLNELQGSGVSAIQSDIPASAVSAMAGEFGRMQTEAAGLSEEVSLLRAQIALQQQEADRALSRALADLRTEAGARRTAERQRDRAQLQRDRAERQRDKVLTSTSWRVTRPIRQIKTMIAGGEKSIDIQIAEERGHNRGK